MRSSSTLPLLLLTLAASSLCAPIPLLAEQCTGYTYCRPSPGTTSPQWFGKPKSGEPSPLRDPHFPAHQKQALKYEDTIEIRLFGQHPSKAKDSVRYERGAKNPKLDAVLKAAQADEVAAVEKSKEINYKSTSTKERESILAESDSRLQLLKDSPARRQGFTASVLEKVQLVAGLRTGKCGMMDTSSVAEDWHRTGKMTITYAYGYNYMGTDYTPILVVSIVVIFILAIILVELLSHVIEASRAPRLAHGAVRLENCNCERGDIPPPYTTKPLHLVTVPSPRSTNPTSQIVQVESLEKSYDFKSEHA